MDGVLVLGKGVTCTMSTATTIIIDFLFTVLVRDLRYLSVVLRDPILVRGHTRLIRLEISRLKPTDNRRSQT